MMETTIDKLLNGRFEVEQPARGYRISVDTLLLASAVPVRANQKVLDVGCGVGGVLLAVACRCPHVFVTGLEIQSDFAYLCAANIQKNDYANRCQVIQGDIANLLEEWLGMFDHVVTNPPYHDPKSHGASANPSKRMANTEGEADLGLWINQSARALREGGLLTMIHRGDRVDEITSHAVPLFDEIRIKPIFSKQEGPAKRVIIRARKGASSNPSIITETPFVLYGLNGRYSEAGDQILREAQEMVF